MNARPKRRLEPRLFTDSLADVSFLLVIFFMLTAVFSATRGLDLQLPKQRDDGVVVAEDSVDVHVTADRGLVVDGRPMALAGLLPYVRDRLAAKPDKPVILRADARVGYGDFVTVLDELRLAPEKAGFTIDYLAIPTLREQGTEWPQLLETL